MSKKMFDKVAIVTLYDNINIGNKLQNYALQEICCKYSNTVTTLTYSEARKLAPLMGWKGRLIASIGFPKRIAAEKRAIIRRFIRFSEFSDQFLTISKEKPFASHNENQEYDCFITGSDQVWHNFSHSADDLRYFFLRFVDEKKRVCYAPSFGLDQIQEEFKDEYIEGLNGFQHLSCRESSGCRMIEHMTGRKAELMPDPTMCLTQNEWSKIITKPTYQIPQKYILVYFIGNKNDHIVKKIKEFSSEMELPIIDIYDLNYLDYYTTRPDEFLYLVQHADYICTNSFHGCIFAIMNHKRIKLLNRVDCEGLMMTDRFSTLFNEMNINPDNDGIIEVPDTVDLIIQRKRSIMTSYIEKVFNDVYRQ